MGDKIIELVYKGIYKKQLSNRIICLTVIMGSYNCLLDISQLTNRWNKMRYFLC